MEFMFSNYVVFFQITILRAVFEIIIILYYNKPIKQSVKIWIFTFVMKFNKNFIQTKHYAMIVFFVLYFFLYFVFFFLCIVVCLYFL